jgi:cysteine desulfurase
MDNPIYLDNNSTTPVDPVVLEAMLPYFTKHFGNPSNATHAHGERASGAVEGAREQVASIIGARPREIVFTSGATESNNLAILGAARRYRSRGNHVVTTSVEHKAVLGPIRELEREGFLVTVLGVDSTGRVSPQGVADAITERTLLVSVMTANNEIGTLQPIDEIGRICCERGILFHTDAAQALGKIHIDVEMLRVDLLSISAHKMYGPKGVGALYVRSNGAGSSIESLVYGGGQENGLRSGTLPVPNIVGLGVACQLACDHLTTEPLRLQELKRRLRDSLLGGLQNLQIHGHPSEHLPGLLSVGFPAIDGDALIHSLSEIAVSQGASCSSGSFEPSHVLLAIGLSDDLARATIRFGIGRFTTAEEVDYAAAYTVRIVRRLQDLFADRSLKATRIPVPQG